jgi:hypothetical protein
VAAPASYRSATAMSDENLRGAATSAARQIAGLPTADAALAEIVALSTIES